MAQEADLDTEVPPHLIRTATGTSYYDIHILPDTPPAAPQPPIPKPSTSNPSSPTPSVLSSFNKVPYTPSNPVANTMPMLPSVSNMFGSRPSSPAPQNHPTVEDQKMAGPVTAVVDEDGCCFLDAPPSRPSSRPATPIHQLKKNIDDESKEREELERLAIVVIPNEEKKEMDKELKEHRKEEKEHDKKIKEKQKEIDKKYKETEKKDKEIDKEIKKEQKEQKEDDKRSRRSSNAAPGIDFGYYDNENKNVSKLPWKKGHQDKGDHYSKHDDDDRIVSAPEIDNGGIDKDGKHKSKLPWKKSRHHEKHKSEDYKKSKDKDAKRAEEEYEKERKDENKEIKKEEKEIDKEVKKEEREEKKELKKEDKEINKEEKEIEKTQEKLEKNIRKEKKRQEKEAKKAKDAEDKERAKERKELEKEREEYVKKLEDGEKRAEKKRDEDHHHIGPIHLHKHERDGSNDSYDSKNSKKGSKKDKHPNRPAYEHTKDDRPKKEHHGLHLPKLGRKKRGSRNSRSSSSSTSDEFEPKYSKAGKLSDVEAKDRSEYDNQGFHVGVVSSKPSTPVGDDPVGTNWYKKGTIPPPHPNVDVIPFDEGPNKFQGNGGVGGPPNIKGGPNWFEGTLSPDKKPHSPPEEKSWIPNSFHRKSPERKPAKERLASETAESYSDSSDDATTEADGRTSIDSRGSGVPSHVAPESVPLPHSSTSLVPTRKSTDKYHIPDRKSGDHHHVRLPILAEMPYPHGLQVPSRKLFSDGFHFPPGLELYGITKYEWEEMVHSFNNHINPHRTWWRTAALVWVFWPAAVVLAYPFKRWGEQHDFNASVEHIMRRVEDADAEIFRPKGLMLRLDKPGEVEGMAYMDMFHRHHVDRLPRAMMVPKKNSGVRTEFPQDLRQAAKCAEQEEDRSVLRHELEGREIAREKGKRKASQGNEIARKASKKRKRSVKHVQRAKERMAKRPRLVIESIKCLEDDRLAEKHGWGVWFRRIKRHTGADYTDDVVTAKNPAMQTFR